MLKPVKNYDAPGYPSLEAARMSPEILKNIPHRWRKKSAVLACMGFVGLAVLSGCAGESLPHQAEDVSLGEAGGIPVYTAHIDDGERERLEAAARTFLELREQLETSEIEVRAHYGGSGSGPFYVARFTEQEAFGFMRAMLEASGLNFNAVPPSHRADISEWSFWGDLLISLELYDSDKNVAVAFPNTREFDGLNDYILERAREDFAREIPGISVGFLYNSGAHVLGEQEYYEMLMEIPPPDGVDVWIWQETIRDSEDFQARVNEILNSNSESSRETLIHALTAQAQRFINYLHAEGVLVPVELPEIPPFVRPVGSEIRVTLNGTPLAFGVAPIVADGRTLVPMRAVFEALGTDVEWDEENRVIYASDGERIIVIRLDDNQMTVNGNPVQLETPPRIINGRMLVPLHAIAEATGADVEWDAETRTVRITN